VPTVTVRYIVDDIDAASIFYCENLGFEERIHAAPSFAMLSRGNLRLALSAPGGPDGGAQAMPDSTRPEPGGWNRFAIEFPNLVATADALREAGAHFRDDIVSGAGGKQILVDDPSGNPVELFEPAPDGAARPDGP
jgi:catechol 2,3-dioxygenase-like lactoylglutathione lyase family enzyme